MPAYSNCWRFPVSQNRGASVTNTKPLNRLFAIHLLMFSAALSAAEDGLDCLMEPSEVVEISSPVQGVLDSVMVERGESVKTGQVVAKLQSGVEEANLDLAKARALINVDINARKAEYQMKTRSAEQLESLYAKKMVSWHEYDEAKTAAMVAGHEYKKAVELKHLAKLELDHAQAIVDQRYLKSTVDGVVLERMKSAGEFIEEQPVMKIAKIDPINVEVIVPINLLGSIKVGTVAQVKAEQPVSKTYQAQVSIVDPVVHASSGTFGVRLVLPNPKGDIQAGLRCKVSFQENR